ncbi:MAG TPA: DUF2232 domain-containing protein [Firmicutes bacterium]|nr:DUF2232 domain-containing protein [Candidatus Fermentithermobacillaceae bacterium]
MTGRYARPLVESALLAALGSVLVLVGYYLPFIGPLAIFIWPLPSAIAVLRHGVRWGVLCSVVTGLSLLMFIDWITAVGFWLAFAVTGVTFGYTVRRGMSSPTVVLLTAVAALVGIVAALASAYFVAGFTPEKLIDEYIESVKLAVEMNRKILGSNPALEQFAQVSQMKDMLLKLFPSSVLLAALLQSYVNFEVSRRVLARLQLRIDPLPPFSRWILPEFIAHAAILSYMVIILEPYHKTPFLTRAAENVLLFLSFLLLVEAFSAISYYLLRVGVPRVLVGLICFYLFTIPSVSTLLAFFGIIDILFDFRRLRYGWIDEL